MHKQLNIKLTRQFEWQWGIKPKLVNLIHNIIWKRSHSCLICLCFIAALCYNSSLKASENIVQKLRESGVLTVGARTDASPFSFRLADNRFAGFAIDLMEEISNGISDDLQVKITVNMVPITHNERLQVVQTNKVDIVCGDATPTWEREKKVDFSVPFFIDGIRLLTFNKTAVSGLFGLHRKIIGATKGSTAIHAIQSHLPNARIKLFSSSALGINALKENSIDVFAGDGVTLEVAKMKSKQEHNLTILPKSGVLLWGSISCILPENQSEFRDLVNFQLMKLLEGVDEFSGKYVKIYSRWFGIDGMLNYPLDKIRQTKLSSSNIWLK